MDGFLRTTFVTNSMTAAPGSETDRAGQEAFETVFLSNWPRVYGLLLRLVDDPAEAEDLALEAFYRLHRSTHVANPAAWLNQVATNLGLDAIRRWKRRQRYELEAGQAAIESAPQDTPAELLIRKEERQIVRRVLAELDPRMAQLLILRYAGMPYREIAAVIQVAPTSIGPLLLRAEKAFKGRLRAAGIEEKP